MKNFIVRYAFCYLLCFCSTLFSIQEVIDFEKDMLDEFVLETKRIEIPGYPDAFNPSVIRVKMDLGLEGTQERLLLSFRTLHPKNGAKNSIGLLFLDDDWNPISSPQILNMPVVYSTLKNRQQDPRLILVGEKLYIIYSDMAPGERVSETRRMFFAEVHYALGEFAITNPAPLLEFGEENERRWQKNWVPFDYNGQLMLAYSINPHRIVQPIEGTHSCSEISHSTGDIEWDFGQLRGGTPALESKGEYLAFFHSSKDMVTAHSAGKKITHYVMGAYTFSPEPPFEITKISSKPIVGKDFYYGPTYKTWKPLRVVFPCGFIQDERFVWIAYGRQDHEVWIAKLDKEKLWNSLIPVKTQSIL
ncbi:MAG: hypothetical protein QRY74_05685 [Chlamydia sp.]